MKIRACTREDYQVILAFLEESFPNSGITTFADLDFLLGPFVFADVIFAEVIKGLVIYSLVFDEIEIFYIAVKDEYQRQGIGRILLQHVLSKGKVCTLEVREHNLKAISFYENQGFKKIGIRNAYYSNGDTAIVYRYEVM